MGKAKVLITGGLGYVGGRLAMGLSQAGYQVTVTSRRSVDGITPLPDPNIQTRQLQSTWQQSELAKVFGGHEICIHLAAANEHDCSNDPAQSVIDNVWDTVLYLDISKTVGIRRFVYFSTMHVYGSPLQGKISERTLPKPIHPYAITHKAAEDFVLAAREKNEIEGIVLRLANSFGPPVLPTVNRWTLLVNDLCRQAFEAGSLSLRSDGSQVRNFITLSDVVEGVKYILEKKDSQDGLFNLGGPESYSILSMAQRIQTIFLDKFDNNLPIHIKGANSLKSQRLKLNFDIEKLCSLGFSPRNEVDKEIADMLEFCAKHFSSPVVRK